MKAAVLGMRGLTFADRPLPSVEADEVRVKVAAAALNHADLSILEGRMHGSIGGVDTTLGLECSGTVDAVGSQVTHVKPGDAVMASGRGAFAEYAIADRGTVNPLPRASMSFEQAAGLPVALRTMHDAVVTRARVQPGECVLVLGGSSAVGLMAMKIARRRGARLVIGTSTDPERRARLAEHGAHLALDTRDPGWPQAVVAATGGQGVNVVIDQLSGPFVTQSLQACALRARIVNVGRLAGRAGEFDFDLHALKRIQYTGVTFRTRTVDEVREIDRLMMADLSAALAAGELDLPIAARYPFDRLAEAYEHMRQNRHFGKIVIAIGETS